MGKDTISTAEDSEGTWNGAPISEPVVRLDWLGAQLVMPLSLRTSMSLMSALSQIEMMELITGEGLLWLVRLKTNYKIRLDPQLEKQVEEILTRNKKRIEDLRKENIG